MPLDIVEAEDLELALAEHPAAQGNDSLIGIFVSAVVLRLFNRAAVPAVFFDGHCRVRLTPAQGVDCRVADNAITQLQSLGLAVELRMTRPQPAEGVVEYVVRVIIADNTGSEAAQSRPEIDKG